MSEGKRRLRGAIGLTFDAVEEVTTWVERTHARVRMRTAALFGGLEPVSSFVRVVEGVEGVGAAAAYGSVRGINRLVRAVVETGARFAPADRIPAGERWIDDLEATLNGVWGEFLHARGNGLDLGLDFRDGGAVVDLADPGVVRALDLGPDVVVFLHGLGLHEGVWGLDVRSPAVPAASFGGRARDLLGLKPLFVRYNTGRPVSDNARALGRLLEQLVEAQPGIESLSLIGHGMGGLVARSAAHQADLDGTPPRWRGLLRALVCLGAPDLGAPVARAADLVVEVLRRIPAAGTEVPGEILTTQGAALRDLRYGYVLEEEWAPREAPVADRRLVLPRLEGVGTYYVASTHGEDPGGLAGRLLGDLLVPVPGTSGDHPQRAVAFDAGVLLRGVDSAELPRDPAVWEVLRRFLEAAPGLPEGEEATARTASEEQAHG